MTQLLYTTAILLACTLTTTSPGRKPGETNANPPVNEEQVDEKIGAMLLGSLIGDAAGGPVEFVHPARFSSANTPFHHWRPNQTLPKDLDAYGNALALLPYTLFRPAPEPYAHWTQNAPPGTLTDDTRHKIILIEAIDDDGPDLTERDLADAYLRAPFDWSGFGPNNEDWNQLAEQSLREYFFAARWVRGDRDPDEALPPTRLWAALPTCAGQMALPPIAGLFPGEPAAAYRLAHDIAFFDIGPAKDINAALVAGLAHALTLDPPQTPADRAAAWISIKQTMRSTDPYRYADVPWTTRPIHQVLDAAECLAAEANGSPHALITAIESENPAFRERAWWEADTTMVMALAAIEMTSAHPTASIRLAIELGYDTDSTAQVAGLLMGALHGPAAFPEHLAAAPHATLKRDYDQTLEGWVETLARARRDRR